MKIEKVTEDVFKVTVSGNEVTQHEVTITDAAYNHLTNGRATKEELLDFIQIPSKSETQYINPR